MTKNPEYNAKFAKWDTVKEPLCEECGCSLRNKDVFYLGHTWMCCQCFVDWEPRMLIQSVAQEET